MVVNLARSAGCAEELVLCVTKFKCVQCFEPTLVIFIHRLIQFQRVAFVAFHFKCLGISRGEVSPVAGYLPWPGLAMSQSQQEDALVNALTLWLDERSARAEDGPRDPGPCGSDPLGSRRVIVSLDVAEDSLQYVITTQALLANMHLLKYVVRAMPKPVARGTVVMAFARVDIQTHMKLSQKFNSQLRKTWYVDEANKLHKILSFARRRWRRFRDGTLGGREGHPLSDILDAFDEAHDDDMLESFATASTESQHTFATQPSIQIPAYPADGDVDDFDELYEQADNFIAISSDEEHDAEQANDAEQPDDGEQPDDAEEPDDAEQPACVIPPYPNNTKEIKDIHNRQPEEHDAEQPDNVDVTPAPKKRRKKSAQSPLSLECPECEIPGPGAHSRPVLHSILAQARLLLGAPKKSLIMKSSTPLEGVSIKWNVEREKNRFWRVQHEKVNIVQVTPKITGISGAALLRDLVLYGVPKEGVEFIKRAGLLPPPLAAD